MPSASRTGGAAGRLGAHHRCQCPSPTGRLRTLGWAARDAGAGLRLQPVTVPAEVQGPQLLPGLAYQVALADKDLVSVPAEAFRFCAVRGSPPRRAGWQGSHPGGPRTARPPRRPDSATMPSRNQPYPSDGLTVTELPEASEGRIPPGPRPRASARLSVPAACRRHVALGRPKATSRTAKT